MKTFKLYFVFILGMAICHTLDLFFDDVGNYNLAIIPAIIGAVGAIGGAALSGALNNKSQKASNATQLALQREQNQFNLEQWNREKDYNTWMWNKENEYNSAVNQRARLEAAGLNPYLMMNGGDAGIASSNAAPAGSPAAPAFAPTPMNYDYIGDMLQKGLQAVGAIYDLKSRKLDIDMKETQAQYQEQQILKSLVELDERTANLRADTRKKAQEIVNAGVNEQLMRSSLKAQEFSNEHMQESFDATMRQLDDAHKMSIIQQKLLEANIKLSAKQIQKLMAEISVANAQVQNINANTALTNKQKEVAQQQIYTSTLERVLSKKYFGLAEAGQQNVWSNNNSSDYDSNNGFSGIINTIVGALIGAASKGSSPYKIPAVVSGYR